MNLKRYVFKWAWFVGGAVLTAFLAIVIFLPDDSAASLTRSASVAESFTGVPIRINIKAIKVNAAVLSLGLAPDGAMAVPEGPTDTAWFNQGSRPGEVGSAVIAGHFGWKDNTPAVFDDLNTLHPGDKILIENDKGEMVTFVVRKLQIFGEKGNAADVFSSNDGKAHLNLITCEGVWNKETKSYSGRLVVFADRE